MSPPEMTTVERLFAVTPGGSQTMSKSPHRFPLEYPGCLVWGDGAWVKDEKGREYLDFICGLGATPLGHNYPTMREAIESQLDRGLIFSLPSPLEAYAAEDFLQVVAPWAEQVRWVKTGSEACQAAARLARMATGRELVIVVGYHGWHDWVQVTSPEHPGIPYVFSHAVVRVDYNASDQIKAIMTERPVAAVMMEPTLLTPPHRGYLEKVSALCALHGALLIFDEMVMGFRLRTGGGTEYFEITPDLACYGKGLANGLPLACVVGKRAIMKHAEVISGTFGGECLSLAAARAVMREYEKGWPIEAQWRWGTMLEMCFVDLDIPTVGYPVHLKVTYEGEQMAIFLQETAARGLLFHPGGFNVPAVLENDDWEYLKDVLGEAKRAMDRGARLQGPAPRASRFSRVGA